MTLLLCQLALGAEWVVGRDAPTAAQTVGMAASGDTVVLPEGEWPGPVVIEVPLTLEGSGTLVGGEGKTLIVDAPGVVVRGIRVHSSGDDLRGPDACIWIGPRATGAVVRDTVLTDCLFGIWVHEADEVRILANDVTGRPGVRNASKGNGIHLFDSKRLEVRGNTVRGARDGVYVSATHDSVIADNVVSEHRYGIHYMYSYTNHVEGNIANHNSGGIALMQSRELVVSGNTANDNERQGILFRDAVDSRITHNTVEGNGEGMFFFSSVRNEIAFNRVAHNQMGARVWAGTVDNDIHDNAFVANREQVFYVAAEDQTWGANFWSDYMGWDQDADGHGDRPYRSAAFTAHLLHRYPQAVLLLSSPTLELLGHMQTRLPALRVPAVVDPSPLTNPPEGLR